MLLRFLRWAQSTSKPQNRVIESRQVADTRGQPFATKTKTKTKTEMGEEDATRKSVQIYPSTDLIPLFWQEKYEKEAKKYWDIFYKRNQDKFFKDRHYLDKEFGHYFLGLDYIAGQGGTASQKTVVLEVGCGAGNTTFPLLSTFDNIFVYACDFSPRAVDLVKAHSEYIESRVCAFVCDATSQSFTKDIPPASVDVVTLIFVLSAVSPAKMPLVLQNIKSILKPNGHVLLRDYAAGDLAQERLAAKNRKISENFYVRGDGTRVFYFTESVLVNIFKNEGFLCEDVKIHEKQVENRSREIVMDRRWIQGAFCWPGLGSLSPIKGDVFLCTPQTESTTRSNSVGRLEDGVSGFTHDEKALNGSSLDTATKLVLCHEEDYEVDLSESIAVKWCGGADFEIMNIKVGSFSFSVRCLLKENQHTQKATGLMIWESAHFLASLLAENPSAVARKRVLELGSGSAGICSMLASMNAEMVVATDGDSGTVELLRENLERNKELLPAGKLLLEHLQWGDEQGMEKIRGMSGSKGFDIIFGADVTYVADAVPLLFETAEALIADTVDGKTQPLLVLFYIPRRVHEASIIAAGRTRGFIVEDAWPYGDDILDESKPCSSAVKSLFSNGLHTSSSIRILCFHHDLS